MKTLRLLATLSLTTFMACTGWVGHAQAAVLSLNGSFDLTRLTGTGLNGLVSEGDTVFVEAFYDTDLVTSTTVRPVGTAYNFAENGAGVRFTVNDLVWETTGPMSVAVIPVASQQLHPDGSVAASYGGPFWLGHTLPAQNEFGASTTIQTPFGAESGSGRFIVFGPLFASELIPNTDLPTNLSLADLAGPFFGHGSVAGVGPNGGYSFDLTSPIPEPETYAMLIAGFGLLGWIGRRRLTGSRMA